MIYIKNIREVRSDETAWAIVRSLKSPGKLIQVKDLAPSKELFSDYMKWKKSGVWDRDKFEDEYVPRFMEELENNYMAIRYLDWLIKSTKHLDITLACFCKDESLCHRSIIAGILQGNGANVSAQADYSHYADAFGYTF